MTTTTTTRTDVEAAAQRLLAALADRGTDTDGHEVIVSGGVYRLIERGAWGEAHTIAVLGRTPAAAFRALNVSLQVLTLTPVRMKLKR